MDFKQLNGLSFNFQRKVTEEADTFLERKTTIMETASYLKVPKSTLYTHLTTFLPDIDMEKYRLVRRIIAINTKERHLRGGMSTKKKYAQMKKR